MKYLNILLDNDISSSSDYDKSMKAQMKAASRSNAKYALIIEQEENIVSVRNMDESRQYKMTFDEFFDIIKKEKDKKEKT